MSQSINLFRNEKNSEAFSAGQTIFRENETGDLMYAVQEGEVDIMVNDKVLETVGPGGIFGEMALIDHKVRSATVVARTDCRVVSIDQRRFTFLVQETPFFALQVMGIMADRLRALHTI